MGDGRFVMEGRRGGGKEGGLRDKREDHVCG